MKQKPYHCETCGHDHDGLPDIGAAKPQSWFGIPEVERARRTLLNSDLCVIDEEDFFIRGVLRIPITDAVDKFAFGMWVSLSETNFKKYITPGVVDTKTAHFGWTNTEIDYYGQSTCGLKSHVFFQDNNQRPLVVLEPTDHPLAIQQRDGITLKQAWDIVHFYSPSNR
jgi:hypothetical protein